MCGILGLLGRTDVAARLYDGLTVLQHRGQDAAGIATIHKDRVNMIKGNGLVKDVFENASMGDLSGRFGIAHVRYPTAGCESAEEAQPFYVNSPYGIVFGHNGNLVNAETLKAELFEQELRHINTQSDSEVLLNVFASALQKRQNVKMREQDVFAAVSVVHKRCKGAYAAVGAIPGYGIVGFRDPFGIRPLILGMRDGQGGKEYLLASESVALDAMGFAKIRDIEPGEAIYINLNGDIFAEQCAQKPQYSPCIFEYVYFARPDSLIDDISVYKARLRMGEKLANKILREYSHLEIDVVIPIPDTSRTAALPLAHRLKAKYREGFMKNRYIGRTFIMPGQEERTRSVRQKLNAIDLEFRKKNVLLVDDSIVRGTTSKQIIQMAREAGARKVYFASAAPPVRFPNVYGIDMPAPEEFIAHNRTIPEICEALGADELIYQDLDDLKAACIEGNPDITEFDASCFTGEYVTGLEDGYFERISALRNDSAKEQRKLATT